jgi:hypothetical protein
MKRIAIVLAVFMTATAQASLVTYEAAIASKTPDLWYKNADSINASKHVTNSGSAASSYLAYRLGTATYTDMWGNANKAMGRGAAGEPAVAGGSGFLNGTTATVSLLFQTPSSLPGSLQNLWVSTGQATVQFDGRTVGNESLRISYENTGIKYATVAAGSVHANTWYYLALTWDTAKPSNDLTWYLGAQGGSLLTGNLNYNGSASTGILMDGSAFPMQEIAIWKRELSSTDINAQFNAIPEPATLSMIGVATIGLLILRRRFTC